ncbi:hypothetical protein, partial [Desulfococcus sp.]|uniref:hypothetical protein n=1 Tax=Desulfococcus sp. TaxID=2025834 RepID=UPI003593639C
LALMVLHGKLCGRVGRRRYHSKKSPFLTETGFFYDDISTPDQTLKKGSQQPAAMPSSSFSRRPSREPS